MILEIGRRSFIAGALALITAPAIVKATSIMPVKASLTPGLVVVPQRHVNVAYATQDVERLNVLLRQVQLEFGKNGEKIGSQLRIRLPNDYTVTDGPSLVIQDMMEQQVVAMFRDVPRDEFLSKWPSGDHVVEQVAVAAAGVAVATKALEQPVTRRFWDLSKRKE